MSLSTARDSGSSTTAGVASVQVAARDDGRSLLILTNDHATNTVYLSLGTAAAVVNKGIRLNAAGGTVALTGSGNTGGYTGPVQAISTGAATEVLRTSV